MHGGRGAERTSRYAVVRERPRKGCAVPVHGAGTRSGRPPRRCGFRGTPPPANDARRRPHAMSGTRAPPDGDCPGDARPPRLRLLRPKARLFLRPVPLSAPHGTRSHGRGPPAPQAARRPHRRGRLALPRGPHRRHAALGERGAVAAGMDEDGMVVVHAPGAFELPPDRAAPRAPEGHRRGALLRTGPDGRDDPRPLGRHGRDPGHHGRVDGDRQADPLRRAHLPVARAGPSRALPESEGGKEDKGREVARAALESLEALDACESKPSKDRMGFERTAHTPPPTDTPNR